MPFSSKPLGGMKSLFSHACHARSVMLVLVVAIIVKMSILIQSLKNLLQNALEPRPLALHFSDDHEPSGDS